MSDMVTERPLRTDTRQSLGRLDRLARNLVFAKLGRLHTGQLTVQEAARVVTFGSAGSPPGPAHITVLDPRFYRALATGGSLGAAEAYIDGQWTCDDLTTLVRIMIRNRQVLADVESGWGKLTAPLARLYHALRRNTRPGSRRNIAAHYDLGNDLFACFLDRTMTYSCGIFEHAQATLEEASIAKLDRLCRKLQLGPQDHVLEIGTGWGSFAIHAAGNYGCRVTTTTISREQHALARRRVQEAGLEKRVTVMMRDYRELSGQYDKLVSIEMIEAVGHHFYNTFFKKCSDLLKPQGMMALQAITIVDQEYDRARREVDFVKRYIFPGSCIPSIQAMCTAIARATDMNLFHLESITPHYATTLRCWRERFFENIEEVRRLGYPETFIRMWEYYLCYCEGGFLERFIGDVQMLLTKPLWCSPPLPPPLEDVCR